MKIFFKKYIILFVAQLTIINLIIANENLPFSHLSIEQGLSNNSVRCIYQDHNGFMWFGTYDGLNRYDGYEFKIFRNKINDPSSLPHNYIYAINEDSHHNLWVGTGQGIGIYNDLTSQFLPAFFFPSNSKTRERISGNVTSIKTDTRGNMFICTNGWGLLVQSTGSNTAEQLSIKKGNIITGGYTADLVIDKKQRVWVFIKDIGLCIYDYATRKIKLVNSDLKAERCMETDNNNHLLIGTGNGIYKYDIISNSSVKLLKIYDEQSGLLSSNNIACIAFDKQQNLWVGTEGGGIDIINPVTEKMENILPSENKGSLSSESVFAIYEDNESRKWIGTLKGGINIMDPQKNSFHTITHNPFNSNSLIYNFVSSFYEDKDRNLWIGTDGGGLSIWDRKLNKFSNFRHDIHNASSLSNNSVTCILQDHLKNTWISTYGGGINKFNRSTGVFEHYRCINALTGEENANAWLLYEDRNRDLWATTFATGKLYKLNREQNRFEAFDQKLSDLISLLEDRSGNLWAGNSHQLIKIDRQNDKHTIYEIGKPVRAIYEDKNGNFWLGTEGEGLILFNRREGKIVIQYTDDRGICNNSVLNILEDNQHQLWLSTYNGLSRFDTEKKIFKNYYQSDGLQSNQFLYSAALKLQSDELVFGGINGFNLFSPDSIRPRKYMPAVLLTSLRINNKPLSENYQYLITNSDQSQELKIPFKDAVLSIDFAAIEYSSSDKISYAYLLEGWDKGWNYSGKIRTVNYTNIMEGTYVLRIKSTNAEGLWNTKETSLKIRILPPWYRSWWAYLIYLILAWLILSFYLRYKSNKTKLEYEIKIAHLNNEKEREINERKFSFFTDISHEFRTPLTLIINPVKEMLERIDQSEKDGNLETVYRNARRLLSLVDQLLLFRKADSQADRLRINKINITELCQEVYLCFVQQAKAKGIEFEFVSTAEIIEIFADWAKMEIVFFNLLSNAIKYTPDGGKVSLSIEEMDKKVLITVRDSGAGIPEDTGDKLFEKFYQVQNKQSSFKTGFGVGLFVVKSYVKSHNGNVFYKSKSGQGTNFVVELLKGTEHFNPADIFNEINETGEFLHELTEESTTDSSSSDDTIINRKEDANLETIFSDGLTMLIADDNKEIRKYIKQIFTNKFKIYEAENGLEALRLAKQNVPDIIISDVLMPELNGVEFCTKMKEDNSLNHIPIILLTASPSAEIRLKGIEKGADDYISKPFEKEFLIARVNSLLKSKNSLQNYFYNEITLQKNNLKISPEYKEFLENCINLVENNLDNEHFTIKMMASMMGMSHSNLYKKMKIISGQSLNGFIRFIRLRKAARLFIDTECNINEAAFQVGMNDTKYFREQFFKLFKMNPSEYIKKYRKSFQKGFKVNQMMIKPQKESEL